MSSEFDTSKMTPEQLLERRRRLDRERQRRCYVKRVERQHGKPFEQCERKRGPRPSNSMNTYSQRRSLAHRLAYEEHIKTCTKIDCSICSISFAEKKPKDDEQPPTCDEPQK